MLTVPEKEHRADGKDFTNMTIIGRPSTWEAPRIRLEPADCRPDCPALTDLGHDAQLLVPGQEDIPISERCRRV